MPFERHCARNACQSNLPRYFFDCVPDKQHRWWPIARAAHASWSVGLDREILSARPSSMQFWSTLCGR
eukprot:3654272-Pyramimonas_sp.AAC.2